MKTRLWRGSWRQGRLLDANEPFLKPFQRGDVCYLRDSDAGVACFGAGDHSDLRYLSTFQAGPASFDQAGAVEDQEGTTRLFELVRQERRDVAKDRPEPQLIGQVPVPRTVPLVYYGTPVSVAVTLDVLNGPAWFADNFYDKEGDKHLVWEKQTLYAALRMRDEAFIAVTFKHESKEAPTALRFAIQEYGRFQPSEFDALAQQFNGPAHLRMVRFVEGFASEAMYDRHLAKWAKKAKLPNPPRPFEL